MIATSPGEDCDDSDANAYEDLGCGCGQLTAETYYDCEGNCVNDIDEDGVCDEYEILGCTDPTAVNYSEEATDDDGSCDYTITGCTDEESCNYSPLR